MKQVYTFDGLFNASTTQARDYSIRTVETWAKWEDIEDDQCRSISDLLLSRQEEEEEEEESELTTEEESELTTEEESELTTEEESEAEKEISHFMNSDITW